MVNPKNQAYGDDLLRLSYHSCQFIINLGESMTAMNAFYAQSGGVTAVINATACGVIETARSHKDFISNVYAGKNGIIGALEEDMIDTNLESKKTIASLRYLPGGVLVRLDIN